MLRRLAPMAAGLLLVLTACTSAPDEGIVLDREHRGAWTQVIVTCSGQPLICRPIPIVHPERWSLLIEHDDNGTWVRVSEETYDAHDVGDHWTRT